MTQGTGAALHLVVARDGNMFKIMAARAAGGFHWCELTSPADCQALALQLARKSPLAINGHMGSTADGTKWFSVAS